jgi:peptidoglycan hydrolase CwlO-like protein
MKIKKLLTIILISIFIAVLGISSIPSKSEAETSCPVYMSDQECLDYLNDKLKDLEDSKNDLQENLEAEQYQQKTLEEKIRYITNEIAQTEKVIDSIQTEIAAKNIEITILEEEISEKEDRIAIMKQEIALLEDIVNKRVIELYKYSFYNTFQLFLNTKDFSNLLRKAKYMISSREKDRVFIEEYNSNLETLSIEEEELHKKQTDLQIKRAQIEIQERELLTEKQNLEAQKSEKRSLLAQSEAREQQYFKELQSISEQISSVEEAATEVLLKLYNTGQLKNGTHVKVGTIIGSDGHTGCAFGTHLHFAVEKNGYYVNPLNYLSYSSGYVGSSTFKAPMTAAYLTQGYHSSHHAIDIVSLDSGYQEDERYKVPYGLCPIVDNILNCRRYGGNYCSDPNSKPRSDWNLAYMRGEGAPIYAVADGTVYYHTDQYGGKYALLVHDDGIYKSVYVHLK